jgi:triacylglycerol lipase
MLDRRPSRPFKCCACGRDPLGALLFSFALGRFERYRIMNIILVHGFFGFRTFVGVEYFNGVKAHLDATFKGLPIQVLVPQINPVGRVEARGQELTGQIANALITGMLNPGEPVHIIAHSMGGLDARYCISSGYNKNVAAKIASLTTIATPHWGSPVADLLTADNDLDRIKRDLLVSTGPFGDLVKDVDLNAGGIQDLTSKSAKLFNQTYRDDPHVNYFSYAGSGRVGGLRTCALLLPTYALISASGDSNNDGLVSVESATWGQRIDVWAGDHADEIGHNLDQGLIAPTSAFNHLEKYEIIVNMLESLDITPIHL